MLSQCYQNHRGFKSKYCKQVLQTFRIAHYVGRKVKENYDSESVQS